MGMMIAPSVLAAVLGGDDDMQEDAVGDEVEGAVAMEGVNSHQQHLVQQVTRMCVKGLLFVYLL